MKMKFLPLNFEGELSVHEAVRAKCTNHAHSARVVRKHPQDGPSASQEEQGHEGLHQRNIRGGLCLTLNDYHEELHQQNIRRSLVVTDYHEVCV